MPFRIVLDTRVLIPVLLTPHGALGQLLDLILAGEVGLAVDDRITGEYREATRRPRFGFAPTDVARVLDAVDALAEHMTAIPLAVTLPDAGDAPLFEVANAARVDALVTGNARHFFPVRGGHEVRVLAPRECLEMLRTLRGHSTRPSTAY